ncbi:formyltransferase family protein [Flagellimonas sediminis]|uniref:phosphoribosylglycinamide formyltransferase 1 n=1 Tax=Flagellimonas sediminis TaxID=2696468 RepID=A0A6I5KQD1_9FLAO|nr:formyltransferase family protein [Allomuricauda sediminis]NDV42633.1 phosphoribosylglycinamide formyltransferase [Allomuricauda sediminis]
MNNSHNKDQRKVKWAFLCSFWGKNAKDVITWYAENDDINKIGLVIGEQHKCGAMDEAQKYNIKCVHIKPEDFSDKNDYHDKLLKILIEEKITHIFLLGYQYLIKKPILEAFPNRIANIHPSLFPSFLGTKTAIQDALEYGVKVTGITTHIIDHRFDRGTILRQEPIIIEDTDTFETLYPKFSEKGLPMILDTMQMVETGMV